MECQELSITQKAPEHLLPGLNIGAGDGTRTLDVQLGKLILPSFPAIRKPFNINPKPHGCSICLLSGNCQEFT